MAFRDDPMASHHGAMLEVQRLEARCRNQAATIETLRRDLEVAQRRADYWRNRALTGKDLPLAP